MEGITARMQRSILSTHYQITVNNVSGNKSSYAIYAEDPVIKPTPKSVVLHFMDTVSGIRNGSGVAKFVISKQRYALCGGYPDGNLDALAMDKVPLRSLGHGKDDGTLIPGPTLLLEIDDGDSPSFSGTTLDASGEVDSFAIVNPAFSEKDAANGKYFEGYGTEGASGREVVFNATFTPSPNVTYQIAPPSAFYVVVADVRRNDHVTSDYKKTGCKVDFGELGFDAAYVEHNQKGNLVLQIEN